MKKGIIELYKNTHASCIHRNIVATPPPSFVISGSGQRTFMFLILIIPSSLNSPTFIVF